eukprot:6552052-Pyramimonas_sp.AAC.1
MHACIVEISTFDRRIFVPVRSHSGKIISHGSVSVSPPRPAAAACRSSSRARTAVSTSSRTGPRRAVPRSWWTAGTGSSSSTRVSRSRD